jgi:hypothetical protein
MSGEFTVDAQLVAGSEKLAYNLDYLNELKQKATTTANLLESSHPVHADRMGKCADVLRLSQFKNGYTSLNSAWWCRVRGCPLCARVNTRRNMGRMAKGLASAQKERSGFIKGYEFPVGYCAPNEIAETWRRGFKALAKFSKLRTVHILGYVASGSVQFLGGRAFISIRAIVMIPNGRKYLSKKLAQEKWNKSAGASDFIISVSPQIESIKPALDWMKPCWHTDLSDIPSELLADYFDQSLNLRRFNLGGIFRELMKDRPKPDKKYYPSELANIRQMKEKKVAYLPDVEDPNFRDVYQDAEFFYEGCLENE